MIRKFAFTNIHQQIRRELQFRNSSQYKQPAFPEVSGALKCNAGWISAAWRNGACTFHILWYSYILAAAQTQTDFAKCVNYLFNNTLKKSLLRFIYVFIFQTLHIHSESIHLTSKQAKKDPELFTTFVNWRTGDTTNLCPNSQVHKRIEFGLNNLLSASLTRHV